ncbi:hypothetical protein [Caulobacter soli]|uniref:hypothetical protein n=1 Tax=Caulobacter soli TaxID=2708539 RepID=UPI0013EB68A4|nr:hypothetical protein [Caulobacter soli]
MSETHGNILAGAGTFVVVGIAAMIGLATVASPSRPVSASTSTAPATTAPPKAEPRLVPLGAAPPDGVDQDSAYTRRQIEAFISERLGQPYALVDAGEDSGGQRVEYCGSARPRAGGPIRYWSIVSWSHAPIEHSFPKAPPSCTGRVLVQAGKTLSFDQAQALIAAAAPPPQIATPGTDASMTSLIDRVTTYAVLVGRGAACGVDISGPSERVGAWMDRVAPPGSQAQLTLLPMFMQQSRYHASQQASGQSPDDCSTVQRAVQTYPWP